MLQVAKCINDRNGGVLRHAFNSLLVESAQYNRVNPAFEIMRDVAKFFSRIDSFVRLVHKKCRSAQAGHARFKRKTRTQRGLLKEHGHLDRKSTRLNSSHSQISYAVFCLQKK